MVKLSVISRQKQYLISKWLIVYYDSQTTSKGNSQTQITKQIYFDNGSTPEIEVTTLNKCILGHKSSTICPFLFFSLQSHVQ